MRSISISHIRKNDLMYPDPGELHRRVNPRMMVKYFIEINMNTNLKEKLILFSTNISNGIQLINKLRHEHWQITP